MHKIMISLVFFFIIIIIIIIIIIVIIKKYNIVNIKILRFFIGPLQLFF